LGKKLASKSTGRFSDAIFLDFLLAPTITLASFSLIPVMGDIAVDMSQGLKKGQERRKGGKKI
jgi:hypothetical protein